MSLTLRERERDCKFLSEKNVCPCEAFWGSLSSKPVLSLYCGEHLRLLRTEPPKHKTALTNTMLRGHLL